MGQPGYLPSLLPKASRGTCGPHELLTSIPHPPQVCPPTDMGRRKSKRKPPPKKKMTGTLETQFTCPFCNHDKSCDMKMDRTCKTSHLLYYVPRGIPDIQHMPLPPDPGIGALGPPGADVLTS